MRRNQFSQPYIKSNKILTELKKTKLFATMRATRAEVRNKHYIIRNILGHGARPRFLYDSCPAGRPIHVRGCVALICVNLDAAAAAPFVFLLLGCRCRDRYVVLSRRVCRRLLPYESSPGLWRNCRPVHMLAFLIGILRSVARKIWSGRRGRSEELKKERESPFHLLDSEMEVIYTVPELKNEVL